MIFFNAFFNNLRGHTIFINNLRGRITTLIKLEVLKVFGMTYISNIENDTRHQSIKLPIKFHIYLTYIMNL